MKSIILFFSFITITFCDDDISFVNNYLIKYGYKDKSDSSLENLSTYITIFQEFNKLTVDGEINNETLSLMKTPRCGNKDFETFRVYNTKWNTTNIKWHYYLARPNIISLAKQAFSFWEKYSGLSFEHSVKDYNILISDKKRKHNFNYDTKLECGEFYKNGAVLAHAYPPYLIENMTEIHMNQDENWYYGNDSSVPSGELSFLYVLIHEIGHSLGISHSDDSRSIMFASYNLKSKIDLSDDDKLAIQSLYGFPSKTQKNKTQETTTKETTIHETTTQQVIETVPEEANQDLCSIRNVKNFLIINKRIYVVYEKIFWVIQDKKYENPRLLTDWLTFLPKNFKRIEGMYQRPSDEVVLIIDSIIYVFYMNNLQVKTRYYFSQIGLNNHAKINCIFNTYTGKTFVIHDDEFYAEIDECSFRVKENGYLVDKFNGLPKGINSCFRYTDGFLYFFKGDNIYKYSEFENEYQKINVHPLSVVDIRCTKDTIKNIIELLQSMIK